MPITRRRSNQPARLQDGLVLFNYILHLLGCGDLDALCRDLKNPALEGIDNEGVSHFYYAIKDLIKGKSVVSDKQLYEYDKNIVTHTQEINSKRADPVQWKYFQYLILLFTEIYLDCFFSDRQRLLKDINKFLLEDFNLRMETWHYLPEFREEDLNKLAFWCATGSGKTLIMHINVKQYLHYAKKHNAKQLNRILLLTPNVGLSLQHLNELNQSGIEAELFSKHSSNGLFAGKSIEVIDINKLAETDGDKTVAIDSFEGNNLVFVDEGHKGSGGEVWKGYRNKLTQEGFSFEYSATFGQAIAAQAGANRDALLQEYGKATLFDYSYRYFYNDGYGKDYRIMNMNSWDDEESLYMYLTAYLLCLYEQYLVFESSSLAKSKFLIEKPLGIFVGGSVNAVRTVRGQEVSDVVQILLFLQAFISRPSEFSIYVKRLLSPNDGIKNGRGYSLFANSFVLVKKGLKQGQEDEYAKKVYEGILEKLFHSNVSQAQLHLDKQRGGDKEIGLRVGLSEYFGVINVGDSDSLIKLCETNGLDCETREFGSDTLFSQINEDDSSINILIGSKKFSEGWSSWRVSAMGLMNVGRSEGAEIIQLFGRGVRLKGYKYSLKRSSALDAYYNPGPIPEGLREIETLNIFGVRADYMETFRKYLEDEGLPTNEETYMEVKIPTVNLLKEKKLKVVRLKSGYDFKKMQIVHPEEHLSKIHVKVDWLPKVEAIWSRRAGVEEGAILPQGKLKPTHLALLNWNKVFFAVEQMKDDRGWWNMEIRLDVLKRIMTHTDWYELFIQEDDLSPHDYGRDVARWEDITIALLRAFLDRAYKQSKSKWESQYLETVYLAPEDPNFFDEYSVEVRNDKTEWVDKLHELCEQIRSGNLESDFAIYSPWIMSLRFDQHLFYPLLCLKERDDNGKQMLLDPDTNEPLIKISPIALNPGEAKLVKDLMVFYTKEKDKILKGKEVYLLRNESRKGIGFFESSGFYPDFILWVNDGHYQHVAFIDPKGIRNLKGLKDPKIQLFSTLKTEIEPSLHDDNLSLDSFIISNTPRSEVAFWVKQPEEFRDNHVLFFEDDEYLKDLFSLLPKTREESLLD